MCDNSYSAAFATFADYLKERFIKGIHTTEDSIRYLFFSSLLTHGGLTPNEIIIEYPHPSFAGKAVDTYVLPAIGREGMVAEFKYDRRIPSAKRKPRSQQAGKIFADIGRLARFDVPDVKIRRYLIYVTDGEMQRYFRNTHNGLEWFLDAEIGREVPLDPDQLNGLSVTFRRNAGEIDAKTSITLVYSAEMPGHVLRIYEINPGNR
ncbi:MAG: Uncharacterized protein XD88_0773 [Methanocalculus sp. 52_23]|jgi:hypothetical protein|nr:MAG: Uncharacterized protein XD88_0773 [Methanocalculus sp. 52_23]